ncbi:MAG: protein kinase [Sporosarcina sp.]
MMNDKRINEMLLPRYRYDDRVCGHTRACKYVKDVEMKITMCMRITMVKKLLVYNEEVRKVSILRSIRKVYQFFVDIPIKEGAVLNGRYEILSVIGTGSYGIVYLCKDLKSQGNCVVKQLRPSKRRNKKEVKLFEGETVILRTLNHKNMPMFYEAFSNNEYFYYAMSFIEGDNLEDQIFFSKKTFNEKEALLILAQLLELVDYLHENDIYHQDLRIPNILLKNNEPFLIDFGLSKQRNLVESFPSPSSFSHYKQDGLLEMKQLDYYDLGEILLYLLYTTYTSKNKKALPWTEELSLEEETVYLLKRLLRIKKPYSNRSEISADLHSALKAKAYINRSEEN